MVADIPLEFFEGQPLRRRLHGHAARGDDALRPVGRDPRRARVPRLRADLARAPALRARRRATPRRATCRPRARSRRRSLEARARVPKEAIFGNNTGSDILDVAESLMRGEILFRAGQDRRGDRRAARGRRRARTSSATTSRPTGSSRCGTRSARRSSRRGASPRRRPSSARTSRSCPGTAGGSTGSTRALQLQKKAAEAAEVEKQFDAVWKQADVKIKSACLCLPGV